MLTIRSAIACIGCMSFLFSSSCAPTQAVRLEKTQSASAKTQSSSAKTQSARNKKSQSINDRRAASGRQMSSIQSGGAFTMGPGKYKPKQYVATLSYHMSVSSSFEITPDGNVEACKDNALLSYVTAQMTLPCHAALKNTAILPRNKIVTHYHLGLIGQKLENYNLAREHFTAASLLDPKFGDAILGLSNIEFMKDNFAAARQHASTALQKDLQHPAYAHYILGAIAEVGFEFQSARAAYARALQLRPHWPEARKRLAFIDRNWPQ